MSYQNFDFLDPLLTLCMWLLSHSFCHLTHSLIHSFLLLWRLLLLKHLRVRLLARVHSALHSTHLLAHLHGITRLLSHSSSQALPSSAMKRFNLCHQSEYQRGVLSVLHYENYNTFSPVLPGPTQSIYRCGIG